MIWYNPSPSLGGGKPGQDPSQKCSCTHPSIAKSLALWRKYSHSYVCSFLRCYISFRQKCQPQEALIWAVPGDQLSMSRGEKQSKSAAGKEESHSQELQASEAEREGSCGGRGDSSKPQQGWKQPCWERTDQNILWLINPTSQQKSRLQGRFKYELLLPDVVILSFLWKIRLLISIIIQICSVFLEFWRGFTCWVFFYENNSQGYVNSVYRKRNYRRLPIISDGFRVSPFDFC